MLLGSGTLTRGDRGTVSDDICSTKHILIKPP